MGNWPAAYSGLVLSSAPTGPLDPVRQFASGCVNISYCGCKESLVDTSVIMSGSQQPTRRQWRSLRAGSLGFALLSCCFVLLVGGIVMCLVLYHVVLSCADLALSCIVLSCVFLSCLVLVFCVVLYFALCSVALCCVQILKRCEQLNCCLCDNTSQLERSIDNRAHQDNTTQHNTLLPNRAGD